MSRAHHNNGRKPIAEISSGSVTIPIYASPVTVKLGKKSSQKAGVDSKPDDGGSDCKTYPSFKIVYYEGTRRVFRRRNTLAKAKALAKELAGQLACDGVRSEYLTEQDRRIYVLAQKAVQPLNLEIDQACRHYADLRNRVKGATLEEAVDFHNTFGQRVRHGATTEEVYQEYLQHLEKRGAGDYHVRDVERLVGGLVNAFPGPIARIDTPDIDDFLSRRGGKSRNKNNWRRGIIAYFNFAQKKNFLPKNLEHAAAATCEFSDPRQKITTEEEATALLQRNDIYTPEEMHLILKGTSPALRLTIEIKGFSGVRTEEIVRLWWIMIDEKDKCIRVPDAVGKIDARLVLILPNLGKRLSEHAADIKHGRVAAEWSSANSLWHAWERQVEKAGVPYRRNAFRNSYISYRLAILQDINRVAEETGTSPEMIRRNYLVPISRTVAEAWFAL
jgi:integrase